MAAIKKSTIIYFFFSFIEIRLRNITGNYTQDHVQIAGFIFYTIQINYMEVNLN